MEENKVSTEISPLPFVKKLGTKEITHFSL